MLQRLSLMEVEWSRYRSGHLNGGQNGHVTEVVSLGRENGHVTDLVTTGGRMVMLQKWSLMEGEWSCYRGGKFNGGRMVMLWRWTISRRRIVTEVASLKEGEWSL